MSLPLLMAASLLVGAPVPADVATHDAARTSAEQRRVLEYWTPARMARAIPLVPIQRTVDAVLPVPVTAVLPLAPAVPLDNAVRLAPARPRTPLHRVARTRQAASVSPSSPGAYWPANGVVARTTGRVFLTIDGSDFVCSAGVVSSASRDLVVTAGHCVKDGTGAWAANWTFVPGYDAGRRPFGTFTARRMFVATPWSRRADDSYDVGMVALNRADGVHVQDAVGAQRIAFNTRRGAQTYGFGFPTEDPYDGESLVYCSGHPHDDPHGQTRDQGMRCDMTAGSSGGPWLSSFNTATGTGTITSLSSFKYEDDLGTMYGPYFGDTIQDLYTRAQGA